MKYVYVGDQSLNPETGKPNRLADSDRATFRKGSDEVTLKAYVPTEVPAALEFRVKGNPHFKAVEEAKPVEPVPAAEPEVTLETSSDGGETFQNSRRKK